MRHHQYNQRFVFQNPPEDFDKYTERELLQYCLGATMYMPGTKDFSEAILTNKYAGLTSMVMCFEDACAASEVPMAEENALNLLSLIDHKIKNEEFSYSNLPLIFFRVRSVEQFKHFSSMLNREQRKLITGFNFPKFNQSNAEQYFIHLSELNMKSGEVLYGMPIIEDRAVAYKESRMAELIGIKSIIDQYQDLVLNIRVGGTDFSSCFGVRRGINYTIYDVLTVSDCLLDILNIFTRDNDYTVSGPVWEYFQINSKMKFQQLPKISVQDHVLKRIPIVNEAVDGIMRELILDKANGFIGKTIIHPTHLKYVNAMYAVILEEYNDAIQIMNTDGGVVKSESANKMNEAKPHLNWAKKIHMRAKAFGVIRDEADYAKLFCEG